MIIEVCVDSVESALNAVNGGADRLELCANLGLGGGTTPSIGLTKTVQTVVPHVPIMVMVRPRTGDFLYTQFEFEVMLEDIRAFKRLGVAGVVIGILTSDGAIDVDRTKTLVQEALPLQAYTDLVSIGGITRVLTSGRGRKAVDSLDVLQALLVEGSKAYYVTRGDTDETEEGPTILPGSGIDPNTIASVLSALLPDGLQEIHLSGGRWEAGDMSYRREGLGMGIGRGEWDVWRTCTQIIRDLRTIVDSTTSRDI